MHETMPEARHQMKDLRQRSTASGSSVISFDYRLDQLKKVIYFLAANDAYEAVPISRSVTVKYCPSTTLPLPTLGLDNKPYTADDVIDDDASCSAAAMAVSSSSGKRATSPRLSFEAKQTPSSIKTFETNVSDDVTNRLLATCLQPDDAVITVIITERTDAEEIEDEDDGRRSAADANGVRQPLLNNRISDVRANDTEHETYENGNIESEEAANHCVTHHRTINLAPPSVFLLLISALQLGLYYTQDVPVDAPNNQLLYNPCLRQEAWPRYLTYIFAHGNGSQLAANLIAQLTLGCVLELVHRWRIIAVYLASALGGCLMHSVVQGDTFTLGAGGAVFGLMGARLVNILLNFIETVCCVCRTKSDSGRRTRIKILTYFICGKIVQFLFVLVCSALSIIDAMRFVDDPGNSDTQADPNPGYLGYNANSPGVPGSRTAEKRIALTTRGNGVHLGGLATGALMGILVLQSISDKQADRKLKLVCLFLLLTFVLFTIGWNVFYVGFPATNSAACHTPSELSLISNHYPSDRNQNTNVGNVG